MKLKLHKTLIAHCTLWAFYISSEYFAIVLTGIKYQWYLYFTFYPIYIGLFYANAFIVFHLKKEGHKIAPYLFVLFELIFTTLLVLNVENIFRSEANKIPIQTIIEKHQYWGVLLRVTQFLLYSTGYFLSLVAIDNQEKIAQIKLAKLENEKAVANLENAYLKAQLKPHMLFNTLSLLHSSDTNRNETSDKIISLVAEQMRYALEQPGIDGKIPLDKEIRQVENMLQLYRLRFPNIKLQVKLNIEDKAADLRIPPMILTTLTENVFKHGAFAKATKPAEITIAILDRQLFMQTRNEKRVASRTESSGLGLNNTINILRNHYPDNPQSLVLSDEGNHFTTTLNLVL